MNPFEKGLGAYPATSIGTVDRTNNGLTWSAQKQSVSELSNSYRRF